MMKAYCFFCETQYCKKIAYEIEKLTGCQCISPQIIQSKWVQGELSEEKHDWLPGYVFLYANENIDAVGIKRKVSGIIKCLGTEDERHELSGTDLQFALMIKEHGGIIGKARLLEVGDRVHVADPCWKKMQGTIVKLDRHRKRCCISYQFDAVVRTVWVGYELVEQNMQSDANNA